MNFRSEIQKPANRQFATPSSQRNTLAEAAFHRMILLERRRTTRSRKSFLLLLLEMSKNGASKNISLNKNILTALSPITRETDVTGWYKADAVVGVMFTEITSQDLSSTTATIMNRVSKTLKNHLNPQQFAQVNLSFHLLPETQEPAFAPDPSYPAVQTDISPSHRAAPTL